MNSLMSKIGMGVLVIGLTASSVFAAEEVKVNEGQTTKVVEPAKDSLNTKVKSTKMKKREKKVNREKASVSKTETPKTALETTGVPVKSAK